MRRGYRFIIGWLMMGGAIGLLWGCPAAERVQQEKGPVTLVFKHGQIEGNPAAFQALLRKFEATHPGILVRDEILPSSSDQQHQFYVIGLEGRSSDFDLMSLDVIWTQEFARAGWVRDLSHLLPPEEREAFFPGPVDAALFEERAYAIPWFLDAGLLYYRKDLLEKYRLDPPQTWEALAAAARTVLQQENDPQLRGYVWQGKQYEGLICNVLEVIWSAGGEVLDEKGEVILAGAESAQALTFLRDLIGENGVSPPMVTTADEETTRRLFGEGRAVFMRNWPYAWNLFQREGSAVRGKVGVSPLPHFPGHASAATLGGWQLAVNRFSRHPKEAEALIRFLTSPEVQRTMAIEIGYKPTRTALYHDPDLIAAQPFIAGLRAVFSLARSRPASPYYPMLSQIMQPEFSAALVGIKTPERALRDAALQMDHLLGRDAG
ncbi:ABC transporter substrate-binding protein [Candidatus Manganitrophus noduliformans]|uniref:ABC transporter substrate-binding protein n=1 Tax=Candidatus Manganitrophus noduliformans TaxID=2606439 RepID=A0A7X6DL74_9BACT|nr:ABC transporter substrate-binding protein [Candidatus Manganitrophus noduliformans]NKE69237.1 ABC transporter substrate-binding protein [Candidatus Manganitrophus noduliformans]